MMFATCSLGHDTPDDAKKHAELAAFDLCRDFIRGKSFLRIVLTSSVRPMLTPTGKWEAHTTITFTEDCSMFDAHRDFINDGAMK